VRTSTRADRYFLSQPKYRNTTNLDIRDDVEQLNDLDRDPSEQQNPATKHPDRCARLTQRLAAWTEANRLQYERANIGNRVIG
jgi:hypothetical protein